MNKRILLFIISIVFIIAGTFFAIKWGRGYRLDFKNGQLKGTGLLVANSFPTGAQVYIDGKLTTATDDTLNLPPGEYRVKIQKDGFLPWEKSLKLEEELVTQTNARLFPAVPELKPLTFSGALNPIPSPDGNKIIYTVASASAQAKNGLWLQELANRPLNLSRGPRQLATTSPSFPFEKAQLVWSPDSSQVLAIFMDEEADDTSDKESATEKINASFLLEASRFNKTEDFRDVTAQLSIIFSEWEQELALKEKERLQILPEEIQQLATASAKNWYFSPDEKKILYTTLKEMSLPEEILPQLPASNTQKEERELKENRIYVYDLEEDKNFFIKETEAAEEAKIILDQALRKIKASETPLKMYQRLQKEKTVDTLRAFRAQYTPLLIQNIQWFPTSSHLIIIEEDKIIVSEYDGTNKAVVYAGPFADNFVYPWPDGSSLIILTSLNPDSPPNLYLINLRWSLRNKDCPF